MAAISKGTNNPVFLNAGVIHGVRNIIVYANLGHSVFSDEGFGHTYAGVGMKVVLDPEKKPR